MAREFQNLGSVCYAAGRAIFVAFLVKGERDAKLILQGDGMSSRISVVGGQLVVALFLCVGLLAQQPAAGGAAPLGPAEAAKQQLEAYRKSQEALWMSDFADLGRYREANARLRPPAAGETRVVFMGDSITDIWRIPEYFPGKPYINRGIGGQTTPQMLIRFREDVIDLQPKVVVILAGTNDIAGNTGPMRLEDIEANLASMSELAHLHRIRVVLSSVTPINDYTPRAQMFFLQRSPQKILELDRWIEDYCAKNHYVYLDYFSVMVDPKGMLKRDLSDDGLHPNKEGFAIMAPLAEKAIEKALAQ
jgi:lysophospholipase L1-like esterase